MRQLAWRTQQEREELFLVTAGERHLSDAIVEKDFWVCWTLDYLFHHSPWSKHLAFKGGTSLSKCFGLIQRFSEDIDVILDWRLLGYSAEESWRDRSKNQQDKFNKAINRKTELFLSEEFLPRLEQDFSKLLNQPFQLFIESSDPQTVCFAYPQSFKEAAILPLVRLEIGALAAWTPVQSATIAPYTAQSYPQVFQKPDAITRTVAPQRTFWEKVTILHKEAFRTNGKLPPRYSRHYYDLYRMANAPVKASALADLPLLEKVVEFKDRFYPAGSAHYDLAKPNTLRLMPPVDCMASLQDDYEHMKNMLFGEVPNFEEILSVLQKLEIEINSL